MTYWQVRIQLRFSQHQNCGSYYAHLPWVSGFHAVCSIKGNSNLQFSLSLEFQKVFCSFGTKMTATFPYPNQFPSLLPPLLYTKREHRLCSCIQTSFPSYDCCYECYRHIISPRVNRELLCPFPFAPNC